MDEDVYLNCSTCNRITRGIGSGDTRDMIQCNECDNRVVAWVERLYSPIGKNEPELYLYEPERVPNVNPCE